MRIGLIIGGIGNTQVDDVDARVGFKLCLERVLHIGAGVVGADCDHESLVGHGCLSCLCRYAESGIPQITNAANVIHWHARREPLNEVLALEFESDTSSR